MPKRKRALSEDSKEDDSKKRKRQQFDPAEVCQDLYELIRNHKTEDGRLLCEAFIRAPKRRNSADYYDIVAMPIDLLKIQQKLKTEEYDDVDSMTSDVELMINNAKSYYKKSSQEYKDACQLWDLYQDTKNQMLSQTDPADVSGPSVDDVIEEEDESEKKKPEITMTIKLGERLRGRRSLVTPPAVASPPPPPVEQEDIEEDQQDDDEEEPSEDSDNPHWLLYDYVRNFQSMGYTLAEPFRCLPSKRFYPDYYKEIKNPVSLYNIRSKVKKGGYDRISELVDDFNLMFENAKQYNRPDSRIYKDSAKLQKVMQTKAKELSSLKKDSDSDSESTDGRGGKRKKRMALTPVMDERKKAKRSMEHEANVKRRMRVLYKYMQDYLDDNGRPLILVFMEKPSKKDYPDYYQVINEPIDMKTIDLNICNGKYTSEEGLISDFQLMFTNCRQYNEEESQIYRDAETLEHALMVKVKELGLESPRMKPPINKKTRSRAPINLTQKSATLFEAIKEYTDPKGRKLSTIFMKLPSRADYPDYYEVIKRPIDIQKIQTRLQNGQYDTLEDLIADFNCLFDNACKYNEPDSQIYKDALTLQRVVLQTKLELAEDDEGSVPDVAALVQELLTSLFTSVYNHQDEEGRCYSDSLAEINEMMESDQPDRKPPTLDIIKRCLDKGRYRRLDHFQEDMFDVFEKARQLSRTDSQVWEDATELQMYFIKVRDELTRKGEVLSSPALRISEKDVQTSVEGLKKEKLPKERTDDEREREQENKDRKERGERENQNNSDSVKFKEDTLNVGDFVYVEPREKGLEPHVIWIEKIWKDDTGEQMLYGCWFYRPNETFHLATRRFLEKEVFKSDNFNSAKLSQVIGKCFVMFVKDYFKYKPEGYSYQDVYVCESRYSAKAKAFKKIKIWPWVPNTSINIVQRDEPITPIRVPSVFKKMLDKPKEEIWENDDYIMGVKERDRPNVVLDPAPVEDDNIYYEQYNIPAGCFKVGDCVCVRSEQGKQLIARIDKMWVDKGGGSYFHGPWFVSPQEITHLPTRTFYPNEVFLSSIEDTNPLLSVTRQCSVLELKDFIRCRQTQIPEEDVHVSESRYMEAEKQIRKLKGLKKPQLSIKSTDDEVYFFKRQLNPQKLEFTLTQSSNQRSKSSYSADASPGLSKISSDIEMEDSNDGHAPSVGSNDTAADIPLLGGKKKNIRRQVTGYILYASEVRKGVINRNPESSFGEISRIVGNEWRSLPANTKIDYEERASRMNAEQKDLDISVGEFPPSPAVDPNKSTITPGKEPAMEYPAYECLWEACDFQFEDQGELVDHLLNENHGHLPNTFQGAQEGDYQCMWTGCQRIKKNFPPFPNMPRLVRHLKECHTKIPKNIPPSERSRNFVPTKNIPPAASPASSRPLTPMAAQPGPVMNTPPFPQPIHTYGGYNLNQAPLQPHIPQHQVHQPPEPLFVAPPPKPQRLLHSEAYIRYIESLQPESRTVSNWDSQLKANQENTPLSESGRLPVHWLGNGVGNHGNAVNALWALRDFMLSDALSLAKTM